MVEFDSYFKTQTADTTNELTADVVEKNRVPSAVPDSDNRIGDDEASKFSSLGREASLDVKTDKEYWNEKDPETGERYAIPLLSPASDGYRNSYVTAMHMKAVNPKMFNEKIMKGE